MGVALNRHKMPVEIHTRFFKKITKKIRTYYPKTTHMQSAKKYS